MSTVRADPHGFCSKCGCELYRNDVLGAWTRAGLHPVDGAVCIDGDDHTPRHYEAPAGPTPTQEV
ncbi:MAG: hypothetical protein WCF36_19020 [Candidatus Nanopelagicales bacterium]